MAKIISVIVSGNPDSNSGFNKLVFYNNPNFDIEDKNYVGFEGCPHFYTIKMTPTHVIFKLVKNNVRSHGAVRPGSLAIAFSIPKNHKLDNGYTPYDVLEDLKNTFLAKCMICKDPVRETYEFNSPFVDQTVLDQVAAKYTISPVDLPERVMLTSGPVGYVVKSEAEIISLFRDFYYPEFCSYSEVVVADTVNQTSYVAIPNLSVPRIKVYGVYVDGVFQTSVSSEEKQITVLSPKSPEYYDCKPLNFTIRQLKDNGIIGVELLDSQERINVSTEGLATPRKIQYQIKFASNEINKYFQDHSNLVEVVGMKGLVPIKNLTFTLTGENNAEVKSGTISVRIQTGSKYTLNTFRFEGNMLKVMVEEKKVYHTSTIAGGGGRTPEANSPVYEVKIQLNERFRFDNDRNTLRIRLKGIGEILSANQTFVYNNKEKLYEGTFLIPKASVSRVGNPCLCFSTKTHEYSCSNVNMLRSDHCVLSEQHFKIEKIGFFARYQKLLTLLCILLITLLLGGLLGYTIAGGFRENADVEQEKEVSTTSPGDEDAPENSMTNDEAKAFLEEAKQELEKEDVAFDKIEEYYRRYKENQNIIDPIDSEKYYELIEDYHELVGYIQNGQFDEIDKICGGPSGPCPNISANHIRVIEKLEKTRFIAHYSEVKSFKDLEENCVKKEEVEKHVCPYCGPDMYFDTPVKLENHLKICKKNPANSNKGNNKKSNKKPGAEGSSVGERSTTER